MLNGIHPLTYLGTHPDDLAIVDEVVHRADELRGQEREHLAVLIVNNFAEALKTS